VSSRVKETQEGKEMKSPNGAAQKRVN
jgi:hypothetical protein